MGYIGTIVDMPEHTTDYLRGVLQTILVTLKEEVSYEELLRLMHYLSAKNPNIYGIEIDKNYKLEISEEIKDTDLLMLLKYIYIYTNLFCTKHIKSLVNKTVSSCCPEVTTVDVSEIIDILSIQPREVQLSKIIENIINKIFEKLNEKILNYELINTLLRNKDPIFRLVNYDEGEIRIQPASEGLLIILFNRLLDMILDAYSFHLGEKKAYKIVFETLRSSFIKFDKFAQYFDLWESVLNGALYPYHKLNIEGLDKELGKIKIGSQIGVISSQSEILKIFMNLIVDDSLTRYGGAIFISKMNEKYNIRKSKNIVNIKISDINDVKIEKVKGENIVTIYTKIEDINNAINRAIKILDHHPFISIVSTNYGAYGAIKCGKNVLCSKLYISLSKERNMSTEMFDYVFEFKNKVVDVTIKSVRKRLYYHIKDGKITILKKSEVTRRASGFMDPAEEMRKKLKRDYGYTININNFILYIRVPKEKISDMNIEDIRNISNKIPIGKIKDKIISMYIISDKSYIELDMPTFLHIVQSNDVDLLIRIYRGIGGAGSRDRNIRRMLDEISEEFARKRKGGKSSSGGSYVYTVGGRGRVVKYRPLMEGEITSDIALFPTIIAAAIRGGNRSAMRGDRREFSRLLVDIRREDIRVNVRRSRAETLLCLVIENGGYEFVEEKRRIIKNLATSILKDAYERRDEVALVAMSGNRAKLLSDFTSDVEYIGDIINKLDYGGLVPLSSGLMTGIITLKKRIGDRPSATPILLLISTGLANVPLLPGGRIENEIEKIGKIIKREEIPLIVVDISPQGSPFLRKFAINAGGKYYHPPVFAYV